jgi:nucleoid-associated protein YgaU
VALAFARFRGFPVSAFKKLFLAATLVGAGLGVAFLLGEPTALQRVLPTGAAPLAFQSTLLSSQSAPGPAYNPSVRLLPESTLGNVAQSPAASPPALPPDPQLTSISAAPISTQVEASSSSVGVATAVNSSALKAADDMPRAHLRSEAPRPIGNEPRSPATIRRAPDVGFDQFTAPSNDTANAIPAAWSQAPQLLPVGYETNKATSATTNAAYAVPAQPKGQSSESSVPWSADNSENGPRTHIVVDGDSLQRLAGRYLNDPNRSSEIYEMNRELLKTPDLLPIGAELKIPDRTEQTSWNREGQRNAPYGLATVREASRLMPLRPISQEIPDAPQARLGAPCPIE